MLTTACGTGQRGHVKSTLDDIGTYINERPDSALTVLRGIDSTGLKTRSMRAGYSLLQVMALYKNYEDITVPGLAVQENRILERLAMLGKPYGICGTNPHFQTTRY